MCNVSDYEVLLVHEIDYKKQTNKQEFECPT